MVKFHLLEAQLLLFASTRVLPASAFGTALTKEQKPSRPSRLCASIVESPETTALPSQPMKPMNFAEMTETILDGGHLSEDLSSSILPLLVWWGKKGSVAGAATVESLLAHLEMQDNEILGNKHYTVAVDAWGKAPIDDSIQRAEKVVEKMRNSQRTNLTPTRVTYNALMNAYSRKGKTDSIEEIVDLMENTADLRPITNDYNVLLGAYARLGKAREAEAVLKRMIDKCAKSGFKSEPDLYSYNMLLDAWAKSNEKWRGERAEEILRALESKFESGEFLHRPDARTYSAAVCAVARSGEEGAIRRAEDLLFQAKKRDVAPDVYLYSSLLDAYATAQAPDSAQRAEELLCQLEEGGVANAVSYNTVLKAWKSSNGQDAAERAEAILSRMEGLGLADTISYSTTISVYAKKGGIFAAKRAGELLKRMQGAGASPNTQTVNSVMNAWVRSGELRNAERTLEEMERSFYQGKSNIVPNVVSYTTLMNGWAKSNSSLSAKKTMEWFQKMKVMYNSGNKAARPNAFSYVTLISCIAKSGEQGAAAESEKLLFEMFEEYERGNTEVKPNTKVASAVIDSWQRSGEQDAGERAEAVLNWLVGIYENDRDESLRPNEFTFAAAISAWARSRKFGKAARARSILTRMIKMKESGQIMARPNAHCYTAVINSCAYTENDAVERREALQIAVETYKELCASEHDKPNQVTFSTVITALRNLLPASEKRAAALKTVFQKCIEEGQVALLVLRRLQTALSSEEFRDLVGCDAVSEDGTIYIEKIPREWRRNTGRQSQTR